MASLQAALNTITAHDVFTDIASKSPSGIDKSKGKMSGYKATFDLKKYNEAIATTGKYEAASNFFWVNVFFTPCPNVPYNKTSVQKLMDHTFSEPGRFSEELVIAVPDTTYNPLEHKGALRSVTPEEALHAMIFAISRDVDAHNAANDVDSLEIVCQWKQVALTTTFIFEVISVENDLYWASFNKRQRIATSYQALVRTAYQQVFEVVQMKSRFEKTENNNKPLAATAVAKLYASNVEFAENQEVFNVNFIDNALTIYNRALSIPSVRESIEWCDINLGQKSPFGKLSKMFVMITKAKERHFIEWVFTSLYDLARTGMCNGEELSVRILAGDGSKKGVVDLLVYKRKLLDYFCRDFIPSRPFQTGVREALSRHFANHAAYRNSLAPYPGSATTSLSWKKGWNPSADTAMRLIEDTVFKDDYDPTIKCALKNAKSPEELMSYQMFAEQVMEIDDALEKERSALHVDAPNGGSDTTGVDHDAASDLNTKKGGAGSSTTTVDPGAAPSLAAMLATSDTDEAKWVHAADRHVRSHCTLAIEAKTEAGCVTCLKDAKVPPGLAGSEYVGIHFNPKLASEAATAPHLRAAPFRKDRYNRLCSAVIEARSGPNGGVPPGDIIFLFDGGRPGLMVQYLVPWKSVNGKREHFRKPFYMMFDEESVKRRRCLVRGCGVLGQIEGLSTLTQQILDVPERSRKHYHGTNKGDVICPVVLPCWDQAWCMSFKEKKKLLGKARVAVGGPTERDDAGDDKDDDVDKKIDDNAIPPVVNMASQAIDGRHDNNIEPLCYLNYPEELYDELTASFYVRDWIDLNVGDGTLAWHCVRQPSCHPARAFCEGHFPSLGTPDV